MTTSERSAPIQIMDGTWSDYTHEILDAPLTKGRWIASPDQPQEFVLQGESDEGPWSLHLYQRGEEFRGDWLYDDDTTRYPVVMRLFRATFDDEWLLLGTWTQPGFETTHCSIRLWPEDADEE